MINNRVFSTGFANSSPAAFIPSLFPRLAETLQNIPDIKVRLDIPFGSKQAEQKVRGELTGLDKNGLQHKQNATQSENSEGTKSGVSMIPNDFFHDNGILLAVPKKKVSHRRKRNHQLGPGSKHQKELLNLDRCPSCGHIKRRHTLCMHCVSEIKTLWKERAAGEKKDVAYEEELSVIDEQVVYPKGKESKDQKKLREKEYLYKPPRTLPFEKKN